MLKGLRNCQLFSPNQHILRADLMTISIRNNNNDAQKIIYKKTEQVMKGLIQDLSSPD